MAEHSIELQIPPAEALSAIRQAAEDWGAEFQPRTGGGTLRLPVVMGLRRGLVSGEVDVEPLAGGSRVVFRPESAIYNLQTAAVVVLLLSLLGAGLTVAWPFVPALIFVAPFGALLALGGWFLVVSRLRTSGPEEFLVTVAAQGEPTGETGP